MKSKLIKPLPQNFNPLRIVIAMSKGMGIGDLILATPLFKAVKKSYPDSYLAVLTSPFAGKILWGNPYINELLTDDGKSFFEKLSNLYRLFKKGNFDLSLHICSRTEDVIASWLAGIKVRVGPITGFLHDHLLNYRFESDLNGWTDESHRVEYLMEYCRVLGNNNIKAEEKLEVYIPSYAEEYIKEEMKKEGSDQKKEPLIIIHPGFFPPLRHFPVEFYLKLGKSLIEDLKARIIITGVKSEYDKTRILIEEFKPEVFDWVGRTDIAELCALISRADLVITHDTGPLHIAAALQIPVVALFGPKSAYSRVWKPYGVPHIVVETGSPDDCAKCKPGDRCKGNFECKIEMPLEKIIEAAGKLVNKS